MATKTAALDHLIDVLAGENIETRGTVATVIDTLADLIEDGTIVIGGGGGGGGDVAVVFFESEDEVYTASMTFEELTAAINAGKAVLALDGTGSSVYLFETMDSESVVFASLTMYDNTLVRATLTYAEDGSVTTAAAEYDLSSLVAE